MRRALVTLALAGLLATLAPGTAHAAPEPGGKRWATPHVCVEDYSTSTYWPIYEAFKRMNGRHPRLLYDVTPYLVFVYKRGNACESAGYTQVIEVHHKDYHAAHGWGWYAATWIWTDATDTFITKAVIGLNDHHATSDKTFHWRISLIEHEWTHAIGPGHTTYCPSIMGPNCTHDGYPTRWDADRVATWYDWSAPYPRHRTQPPTKQWPDTPSRPPRVHVDKWR